MNIDEIIEDSFGQPEPSRHDALRRSLDLLLDDGDSDFDPPPGLADLTTNRIAAFVRNDRARILEFAPSPARVRWSDLAVAASILVAGLLTLVPALDRSRLQMSQVGCLSNLRQIGQALNSYLSVNRSYPFVNPRHPGSYVGSYAVLLNDGGYLPDTTVLDCPCGGHEGSPTMPAFELLCEHERKDPGVVKRSLPLDYAYSLGRRSARGEVGPPSPSASGLVAVVADRPPFAFDGVIERVLEGNSPVHAGLGQNVLFTGGNAKWQHSRFNGSKDDDLYLNQHHRLAPGLNDHDAVLTPAVFRFRQN